MTLDRIKARIAKRTSTCAVVFAVMAGTSFPATASASSHAALVPPPKEQVRSTSSSSSGFLSLENYSSEDTAIKFVRLTGLSKNLSLLLLHDVKDDAPIQAAIEKYGMDTVQSTVVRAIKAAQYSHSISWDRMLAGVYMKHFSSEALLSLQTKREASPHFIRLLELQDTISSEIQEDGKEIYKAARSRVMSAVATELPA